MQSERWSPTRWWTILGLIVAGQLSVILWLGERQPLLPRRAAPAPVLQLTTNQGAAELFSLTDPTLFALPHPENFSGSAWLTMPSLEIQPFTWSEPPRFLTLPLEQLAAVLPAGDSGPPSERWPRPADSAPALLLPRLKPPLAFPTRSTFRKTGALESRRLQTAMELPSWPNTDLLTNTVVQVLVDAEGMPRSVNLLGSSGKKEADDFALRQAGSARFEPLPGGASAGAPLSGLAWGTLVFQWHTVATNATAP